MMECEMCGKAGASVIARVEGTEMKLCERCAKHGTSQRAIPHAPTRRELRHEIAKPRAPHEPELIESVHPNIAKMLSEHRQRLKLTQEEFARKLNIRASVYAHYESGSTLPSIETARALERELHRPLVVKIRIGEVSGSDRHGTAQGLTLGDMMKKR